MGRAVQANVISAGAGSAAVTNNIGVHIDGQLGLDFVGNTVDGGMSAGGSAIAVVVQGGTGIRLLQNRIYGGSCAAGATPSKLKGVQIAQAGTVEIANNLVHGGNKEQLLAPAIETAGVLIDSADVVVHHNSIHTGYGNANQNAEDTTALIVASPTTTGTQVENNILAGIGGAHSFGVAVGCADAGQLAALRNNLFFGLTFAVGELCMGSP